MEMGAKRRQQTGQDRFSIPHIEIFSEKIQTSCCLLFGKTEGSPYQPEALVFETGTNKWVSYDFLAALVKMSLQRILISKNAISFHLMLR